MTRPRRFNANHATRAVLTLSAALLFGLGFRLGDAALSKSSGQSADSAAQPATSQPVVSPSPTRKATNPNLKAARLSTTPKPQVTLRPSQPAVPRVAAQVKVPAPTRVVSVTQGVAETAPQRPLPYDSEREDGEEGEDESGPATYRPAVYIRTVATSASVRGAAVQATRPSQTQARSVTRVRPRVARPVVRAVPTRPRLATPVRPHTVTPPQTARPRFVPQAPVRARATTRGS